MKKMRRIDRMMTDEEALVLLEKGEYGILCTADPDGQPFGTPVSYVFTGRDIYFHAATAGAKLDNIKANPKVCFTVVGATEVLPGDFSTNYESVMAFGKASMAEGEEKAYALAELVKKYSPDFIQEGDAYILKNLNNCVVVKIEMSGFSGKHRV
ncbi:MAG: putative flavin-nucleotide-binding protein [Firmicutes bacterium]|nr:putative flavin-nucleotide-binding protein [Bacillota bacterium]